MRFEKFEKLASLGGGHAFRLTDCHMSGPTKVQLTMDEARQLRFILNNEFKDEPIPEPVVPEDVVEEVIPDPCPICKVTMDGTGNLLGGTELMKCPKCQFVCKQSELQP